MIEKFIIFHKISSVKTWTKATIRVYLKNSYAKKKFERFSRLVFIYSHAFIQAAVFKICFVFFSMKSWCIGNIYWAGINMKSKFIIGAHRHDGCTTRSYMPCINQIESINTMAVEKKRQKIFHFIMRCECE